MGPLSSPKTLCEVKFATSTSRRLLAIPPSYELKKKRKEKGKKAKEGRKCAFLPEFRVNNNFYRATDFAKKGGTGSKNVWLTFLSRKNWDEQ